MQFDGDAVSRTESAAGRKNDIATLPDFSRRKSALLPEPWPESAGFQAQFFQSKRDLLPPATKA